MGFRIRTQEGKFTLQQTGVEVSAAVGRVTAQKGKKRGQHLLYFYAYFISGKK